MPKGMSAEDVLAKIKAIQGPVLINHWATWCEGCVEELPLLVELQAHFRHEVTFVGVSWELFQFERPDAIEHAEDFAREHGVAWSSLFLENRPGRFFDLFEMECMTIPQIELQNAKGEVVYRLEQVLDLEEMKRLRSALESL